VTDIIGEIRAASVEQESNILEIDRAITDMDTFTQENSAQVEEAAAAARSLQDQADDLRRVVGTFELSSSLAPAVGAGRTVSSALNTPRLLA